MGVLGGDLAAMIIATLEGAMLVAGPCGDLARFDANTTRLLADLATATDAR